MRTLLAALLLAPATSFAGAYAIPNENARDLALSQSNVAAQTGPEAAKQNIAALAGQEGVAISASGEMLYNTTSWSDPKLGAATLRAKANFPPEIAVAWGGKLSNGLPIGVGIAFLVPGGGSLVWPTGWPGAGRIQEVDQRVYLVQGGAAIQPFPWAKFGGSLLYYRVTETLSQQLDFLTSTGLASLGLAGGALTYGLSGEFHVPGLPLAFGVDYRHQAPMTISGKAHFDGVPPSFASALQDQGASEAITIPNELYLGAAYEVIPGLKAMGSWSLERWRSYRSDTYIGDKGLVISVPRNEHNAWVYRVGGEYAHVPFWKPLTLRAGAQLSVSDQPSDFISPTLTDATSWAFSAGLGYDLIAGLRLDVAYQFALFDKVTATGIEAFPGSYETKAHLVSVGLEWRMK